MLSCQTVPSFDNLCSLCPIDPLNPNAAPFQPTSARTALATPSQQNTSRSAQDAVIAIFINICSLGHKVAELEQLAKDSGAHLIAVAETWSDTSVTDGKVTIPGFSLLRKYRSGRKGGGIAIYHHKCLTVRARVDLLVPEMELLWLEVVSNGLTTLFGCGYRPPSAPVQFWTDFEDIVERAVEGRQTSTILMGDFNVDFAPQTLPLQPTLQHILTRFNLTNYVTSSTRITATSSSTLDLLLAEADLPITWTIVTVDISDHFAVVAKLPLYLISPAKRNNITASCRKLHQINWPCFKADLLHHLSTFKLSEDLDTSAAAWHSTITAVIDKHAPVVSRTRKKRRAFPW